MPELSFDEIKDGDHFEELVAAYFRMRQSDANSNIKNVDVRPPATGPDGGIDILVEIMLTDGIKTFTRKWIIQCKFHKKSISPNEIADINLPTLIHSYKACGYLLICKERPTQKLAEMFKRLTNDCSFGYSYEIWSGESFKAELYISDETLQKQFFPKYYQELQAVANK